MFVKENKLKKCFGRLFKGQYTLTLGDFDVTIMYSFIRRQILESNYVTMTENAGFIFYYRQQGRALLINYVPKVD